MVVVLFSGRDDDCCAGHFHTSRLLSGYMSLRKWDEELCLFRCNETMYQLDQMGLYILIKKSQWELFRQIRLFDADF